VLYISNNEDNEDNINLYFNPNTLNISNLKTQIIRHFEIKPKNMRMYNFYGLEIYDDSDLFCFQGPYNFEKILFVSEQYDTFDSKFILKLFDIKKKLGNVSLICNKREDSAKYSLQITDLVMICSL